MILLPWGLLMVTIAWKYGVAATPPSLPAPYRFLGATALMAFAAIVGEGNATIGALLAWGILLGAITYSYTQPKSKGQGAPGAPTS